MRRTVDGSSACITDKCFCGLCSVADRRRSRDLVKRFAAIAAIVVAGGASSPTSHAAAVRAAMAGFMDALNALDADRMASYFADDITAFVPLTGGHRRVGG